MPYAIAPTTPDDLPGLSRFLAEGFDAGEGGVPAALLEWKYFDPNGEGPSPDPPELPPFRSALARDTQTGEIVGHMGVARARFRGPGVPAEGVATLHMMDWLASRRGGAGAGASLMRRAHASAPTGYGLGGSAAGRAVIDRAGYPLVARVPVYRRVFRPGYRLRDPSAPPLGRLLRAAKDLAGRVARPGWRPVLPAGLTRAETFGDEIEPVLEGYAARAAFAGRGPGALNHLLRCPVGEFRGWHVRRGGRLRGFGVLGVVPRAGGAVREGRLVDCLLDDPHDPDLWLAAVHALTEKLKRRGADFAVAYASTEWAARALRAAGYAPAYDLEFRLRDPKGLLPRGVPYHLTMADADYAYM